MAARLRTAAAALLAGAALIVLWPSPLPLPSPAGDTGFLACAPGATGAAGRNDEVRTQDGLGVTVVTPSDYRPGRAYGLLVLFPPAGLARGGAERYYGLTEKATRQGWIVAYSDHLPLGRAAVAAQARVPAVVRSRWCIDPSQIVYAGHSDGATIAQLAALSDPPAAIIASAAGIDSVDLAAEGCAGASDVLVLHNPADERFPSYGQHNASVWAACLGCAPLPSTVGDCVEFPNCRDAHRVALCPTTEPHARLPQSFAARLLAFSATHNHRG